MESTVTSSNRVSIVLCNMVLWIQDQVQDDEGSNLWSWDCYPTMHGNLDAFIDMLYVFYIEKTSFVVILNLIQDLRKC